MDDMTRFEERFEERIRAFAMTGVQSVDSAAVARAVAVGHPKSAATRPARRRLLDEIHRPRRSMSRTTFAAAAVVAMLALGGALFVVAGDPSPTPSADPSPSLPVVVAPSSTPSATNRPTDLVRRPEIGQASGSPPARWARLALATTAVRLLDGRVLVVGGANDDENDTSAELYDPVSGTWSATGNMLKPHGGFPATLLRDGRVLVGDGDDPNADDEARWNLGAEVYDPASGTWTATGKMVTPDQGCNGHVAARRQGARDGHRRRRAVRPRQRDLDRHGEDAPAARRPRGRPAARWQGARGGRRRLDIRYAVTASESAELYDPATGTWTATAPMNDRTDAITATLLPRRQGARYGRDSSAGRTLPELYDPATGTWTAAGDMRQPGTVPIGHAVVGWHGAGGAADRSAGAELYDPGTGSWTTTGSMLREHGDAPAHAAARRHRPRGRWQDCLEGVCTTAQRSCTSLPACRRPRCQPSRARPRSRLRRRARPRSRPRSRPRPVPSRRTHGPGRSRSRTGAPNPRRCSWPRRTSMASWGGWSGPRPRTSCHPAPPCR